MRLISPRGLAIFLSCFLMVAGIAPLSAKGEPAGFALSAEEQAYLEALRERPVRIAYSYGLVNATFDGEPCGLLEPVLDVLRSEFGLTVELVNTNWHDAFLQVESGETDFYGPIAISDVRRQKYITVDPFFRNDSKIITRTENPVHSMLGLYNRSIGLLEGSVISRTMQVYLGPSGQIVYFATMDDMIQGLKDRTIDAFATVDNAEFEILRNDGIQFEFSIDNFYVDQGLISGNKDMRTLAAILSRYLKENPQVSEEIVRLRSQTLIRYAQERLADEIAYMKENHSEVTLYTDFALYPLCYMENGEAKGMQMEINEIFMDMTGVPIRFGTPDEYPDAVLSAIDKLKTGECMALVGGYYDLDTWNDPDIEYSPLLWMETLRTYSAQDSNDLLGKIIGVTRFTTDYLGWNNTTGNAPMLYNSRNELADALKSGEIDAVFMGEMRYNFGYSVLKDYTLREVPGISASAPMHMLYGAQNAEFNALYNQAMVLFHIIKPTSLGRWRALSDNYKSDLIRMRHTQQIWVTVVIVVFILMLAALIYLLRRVRFSLKETKRHNLALLDKVHYDPLTGIRNRRYYDENIKRIIKALSRSGGKLSVLMIDVDYFKQYNDTYGHAMGDECLKSVACMLSICLGRDDDFTARYGGEEFVAVLPNTDENGARMIANMMLEMVAGRKILHEKSDVGHVTISIGVTTGDVAYPQSGDDYLKRADEALYASKKDGRNRYTFLAFSDVHTPQ